MTSLEKQQQTISALEARHSSHVTFWQSGSLEMNNHFFFEESSGWVDGVGVEGAGWLHL